METIDKALRPKTFAEYAGQPKVAALASVAVRAATMRGETLDHVLIEGPPGLGKTTLAAILAQEMGSTLHMAHAAAISKPDDVVSLFMPLATGDMLFVDEIHALPRTLQEYFYTAMEDGRLDFMHGDGKAARLVSLPLTPFTLIGATTRGGDLDAPFRARFGLQLSLEWLGVDALSKMLATNCEKFGMSYEVAALSLLASRSRGTPRAANRLLRRCRDYATVGGDAVLSVEIARQALDAEGVDDKGLTDLDRAFLTVLIENFNGGPAGLAGIASSMGRGVKELEEVCEPYLLRSGFIVRTPRGRKATAAAYTHLNIQPQGVS